MGELIGGGLSWWRFLDGLLCAMLSLPALVVMALDSCFNNFFVVADGTCGESRPPSEVDRANGHYQCHLWWVV